MDSLDTLNGSESEYFEKLLYKQLLMVYRGNSEEKYRACDFRHLGVSRGESHIAALQGLFEKLSDNAQEQFRGLLGEFYNTRNYGITILRF
jgi:hypothetical protein